MKLSPDDTLEIRIDKQVSTSLKTVSSRRPKEFINRCTLKLLRDSKVSSSQNTISSRHTNGFILHKRSFLEDGQGGLHPNTPWNPGKTAKFLLHKRHVLEGGRRKFAADDTRRLPHHLPVLAGRSRRLALRPSSGGQGMLRLHPWPAKRDILTF